MWHGQQFAWNVTCSALESRTEGERANIILPWTDFNDVNCECKLRRNASSFRQYACVWQLNLRERGERAKRAWTFWGDFCKMCFPLATKVYGGFIPSEAIDSLVHNRLDMLLYAFYSVDLYNIIVRGAGGSTGNFQLRVNCPGLIAFWTFVIV